MGEPTSMQALRTAQAAGDASKAIVPAATALAAIETASTATAAKVKALVQARYEVALHKPRDLDVVRDRMLKECQRPRFAESSKYSVPRGRKKNAVTGQWEDNFIIGPSIRFAEMAIRNMTNVVIETMTVYDDREKRIVNVSVTDLEGNVPYAQDITVNKTVERRKAKDGDVVLRQRQNSQGDTVYLIEATDDEILNHQNALISKAIRTLALRLVPGDIIDECMERADEVLRNADAQSPDAAKRRVFDSFSSIGISVDEVKKYLGHNNELLTPKELESLRGIYLAIKDGTATWTEVMDGKQEPKKPPPKQPETTQQATQQGEPTKKVDPPETQAPPKQPESVTVGNQDKGDAAGTYSDAFIHYRDTIRETTDSKELPPLVVKIMDLANEDERDVLLNMVNSKIAKLKETRANPLKKPDAPAARRRTLE